MRRYGAVVVWFLGWALLAVYIVLMGIFGAQVGQAVTG